MLKPLCVCATVTIMNPVKSSTFCAQQVGWAGRAMGGGGGHPTFRVHSCNKESKFKLAL